MSEQRKNPTAEEALAPQLGSALKTLKNQEPDMSILSVINEFEAVWMPFLSLIDDEDGGEFARAFVINKLHFNVSIGGRGRTDLKEAIGYAKGISQAKEVDLRSRSERWFTMRDKDKARKEGKIVNE